MQANVEAEFLSIVRGAILLLFLVNLGLYFQNKRKLFLNYSLYLGFVFVYVIWEVLPFGKIMNELPLEYFFLIFSFVFYIEFERLLLRSRDRLPVWDGYFKLEKYLLVIIAISLPLFGLLGGVKSLEVSLFVFSNAIGLFTIISYRAILKIKDPTVKYFVFGSLSYIIIGNTGTYVGVFNEGLFFGVHPKPQVFMYLGIIVEALFFIYILGIRIKNILEEGAEIKVQNALKLKEIAELKMIALQSQMNPHFLFNSLNSINNYVLKKDKEEASEYIGSFAKLVRKILRNSSQLSISLEEELEVLDSYVALEMKRLPGGFEFEKEIDKDLDLKLIAVPPLFLQPFLENSIWHGLAGVKEDKKILLKIYRWHSQLVFEVIDNGVGLKEDFSKASNKGFLNKKSFATVATKKRLDLMYSSKNVDMSIKNQKGKKGVKVEVKFPFVV